MTETEKKVVFIVHMSWTCGISSLGYLKGPRSPADVKKLGYAFTQDFREAWTFPNFPQASRKARILERHFGYSLETFQVTSEEVPV